MLERIKSYFGSDARRLIADVGAAAAYDLWAENYDNQPGNLMLDLDEELFSTLLEKISLKGKRVADFGCGTGRHWTAIYGKDPAGLVGFDISENMLQKLRIKYPRAVTKKIDDVSLSDEADSDYDVIVSTLTIAHVENVRVLLAGWCRILRLGGDIILTDFHPDLLAAGGKRTFLFKGQSYGVKNFVHPVDKIKMMLKNAGFSSIVTIERRIDERVRYYYQRQDAMELFYKFENQPLIYGLHAFNKCY